MWYQINKFSFKILFDALKIKYRLFLDFVLYELEENKKCQVSLVVKYISLDRTNQCNKMFNI